MHAACTTSPLLILLYFFLISHKQLSSGHKCEYICTYGYGNPHSYLHQKARYTLHIIWHLGFLATFLTLTHYYPYSDFCIFYHWTLRMIAKMFIYLTLTHYITHETYYPRFGFDPRFDPDPFWKFGYPEEPDSNPDSKILDPSKPNLNLNILIFSPDIWICNFYW